MKTIEKRRQVAALQKGFTLIELLAVIAIIAIIAAILFPVFGRAKEAAKKTACISNARQIGMALKMYVGDHDDVMPIFYAYNSQPPHGSPGHKGVEVLLLPYCKSQEVFKSPLDAGGPYTSVDVPGANTYWKAYGSSYRFTQCVYTIAANESSQNNTLYDFDRPVMEGQIEYPAETRIMRLEMFPFFSRSVYSAACERYGYDCDPPSNYYRQWGTTGGSMIFSDGHARHIPGAGAFDESRVDPEGHRSGEANPDSWSGTWYGVCD